MPILTPNFAALLSLRVVIDTSPPPTAPSGLVATTFSESQIDLLWIDESSDEDGFKVERSLTGVDGWSLIATTVPGAGGYGGYSDEGLDPETTYYYRVRAFRGSSYSSYDGVASDTTQPLAPPLDPGSLVATTIGPTAIDLSWQDNSNNEDGFSIERSADGGSTWDEIDTVLPNVDVYSDTGLTPSTTYQYRVRGFRGTSYSDYTAPASATTDPAGAGAEGVWNIGADSNFDGAADLQSSGAFPASGYAAINYKDSAGNDQTSFLEILDGLGEARYIGDDPLDDATVAFSSDADPSAGTFLWFTSSLNAGDFDTSRSTTVQIVAP